MKQVIFGGLTEKYASGEGGTSVRMKVKPEKGLVEHFYQAGMPLKNKGRNRDGKPEKMVSKRGKIW